ncbi:MAG TPA: glycosyltransferase family 2 protein [Gemmataceae bacterium]|nr:glycosyltransferase family 2 protein [Gemmataceae bacterium]
MLNFFVGNRFSKEPEALARKSLARASGSINIENLVPWQDLEPGAISGTWRSTGVDPQFRAACHIPAGWIRVRLQMSCEDRARVELLVDTGQGFNAAECLERLGFRGTMECEFFVNLPRPVIGVRLDPRDTEGTFRLEKFEIRPVPRLSLLGHALWAALSGERRGVSPTWNIPHTSGLRPDARPKILQRFKRFLLQNVPGPSALAPPPYDPEQAYAEWRKQRQLTDADCDRMRASIRVQKNLPRISIIMPRAEESDEVVALSRASLQKQIYPNWEICSDKEESGEYVTLLRAGDELAEHALFQVARAIAAEPNLDMIYSDEDEITDDGRHVNPFFKPDWSPETLRSFHYTGGLTVYRTSLVRDLGGFDKSKEYELVLRLAAHSPRVKHLADVLVHRRRPLLPPSVSGTQKRLSHAHPFITILIPTAYQADFLMRCLTSIRQKSTFPNYKILVLDNNQPPPEVLESLRNWGISRMPYEMPFNWARTLNQGAALARGEHLLFLDDDTEVITPDWIERLLEFSQHKEIGVVGARLQFPDGRLQHAGVAILNGVPGHPFYGYPEDHPGYFFSSVLPRNYSAVTGACLMTRAEIFRSAGGFDETFAANFNDIDYCLRVGRMGLRAVCNPFARLVHHETATKTAFSPRELASFQNRWRDFQDPYMNPNLSKRFHDFRIDS